MVNAKKYAEILRKKAWKREYHKALKKMLSGSKLTEEEKEVITRHRGIDTKNGADRVSSPPLEATHGRRHETLFNELAGLLKGKEKIAVNDIGYGEPGLKKSRTKQPWEIINTIEKTGTKVNYWGYDYYEEKAKLTEKQKPEEYKEKASFSAMDIVTATPSRKADVTIFLNVKHYLTPEEKEVAVKHVADSTRKGGYVVTDIEPSKVTESRLKLVKQIVEKKTGRTKYIYQRVV